jgi:hypothetical protein
LGDVFGKLYVANKVGGHEVKDRDTYAGLGRGFGYILPHAKGLYISTDRCLYGFAIGSDKQ